MRRLLPICALLLLAGATSASAMGKGTSMFSVQLGQGQGDFASLFDPYNQQTSNYLTPNASVSKDQIQFGAEYWYVESDDYAFTAAVAFGNWSLVMQPGNLPPIIAPGALPQIKFAASSLRVRAGMDRVGNLGERFVWFMGPGLEYWSGNSRQPATDPTTLEVRYFDSPKVDRLGINGRVGATMLLTRGFGITGRVGNSVGLSSTDDKGATSRWFSGTWDAMWGMTFAFGGGGAGARKTAP